MRRRYSVFLRRLCMIQVVLMLALVACSNEPILLSNDVDLTPLLEVPLPVFVEDLSDVMDTSIFTEHYRFDHTNSIHEEGEWKETWTFVRVFEEGSIRVELYQQGLVSNVETGFTDRCFGPPSYKSESAAGLDGNSQYIISYLKEMRAGPEGLSRPLGEYTSCIVVQRSNLQFMFREYVYSTDRNQMNAVIAEVAEAFYQLPN